MTPQPRSSDLQNLSNVGNIATAGLQLYRSRFGSYFKLALTAHLWLLVPLVGWMEAFSISTLIARSAFADLMGTPTAIATLKPQINTLRWRIFVANSGAISIITLVALGSYVVFVTILALAFFALRTSFPKDSHSPLAISLGSAYLLLMAVVSLFSYSPFFVMEVAAAVEHITKPIQLLRRSLVLSSSAFFTVVGVIFTVFMITFPLSFAAVWLGSHLLDLVIRALPKVLPRLAMDYAALGAIALFTSILTFPIWQTTKAVLYYALRHRCEGLDLQLRE